MTKSHDSSSSGCFSSIFRPLTCSRGLPTHPSPDTNYPKEQTKLEPPSLELTTTPPSIVARLMGLDSLPNSPHSTKLSVGTIMRKSKSVGSLDFLPNFDMVKQPHYLRTSISFREVTTTTLLQSSHNHDDHANPASMGLSPIQEKPKSLNKKHRSDRRVKVKSRSTKKVVDDEFPEKNKNRLRRRRYNHPLPNTQKNDAKEKEKPILKRRESEYSEEYCIKVLVDVCRLTMEEIQECGVSMDTKVVNNNLHEISYEIGHDILQLLVYEMVDELCKSMYH